MPDDFPAKTARHEDRVDRRELGGDDHVRVAGAGRQFVQRVCWLFVNAVATVAVDHRTFQVERHVGTLVVERQQTHAVAKRRSDHASIG